MQSAHLTGREIHFPHAHVLVLESQVGRDRAVIGLFSHGNLAAVSGLASITALANPVARLNRELRRRNHRPKVHDRALREA